METFTESILIYGLTGLFCGGIVLWYLLHQRKLSRKTLAKIELAKEEGLYEPVSLHPVVDPGACIMTGACIAACPEKDILGIVNGRATTVNASHCVGHGACFHACPTEAISLCIGTEKRGVELPHVNAQFESNVPGIFIAGELGGMGLIRNAVAQGKQAVENIARLRSSKLEGAYDLVIIGAGPAGIAASLKAKMLGLNFLTLEQDSLGGTVFTFPRDKVVMTSPLDLPLYGKVKLQETSKAELLGLWQDALEKNQIEIQENRKVERLEPEGEGIRVFCQGQLSYFARSVLLAIGRRGTPRKLGIPGESGQNVAYRLLEPDRIRIEKIVVVGGGDSAIESALLLCDHNQVSLSYRGEAFGRLKPRNRDLLQQAEASGRLKVLLRTQLREISLNEVIIEGSNGPFRLENHRVFIFAGGELPTRFLENAGIKITKKFEEAILSHRKSNGH